MIPTIRLTLPIVAFFICCEVAAAQTPTAPPPHLTLNEVVKEYWRHGLSLPSANAELVRIRTSNRNEESEFALGFRVIPASPKEWPEFLMGSSFLKPWHYEPEGIELAIPHVEALRQVKLYPEQALCFAVQCQTRGWNELATELYEQAREGIRHPPKSGPFVVSLYTFREGKTIPAGRVREERQDVLQMIRKEAWGHWEGRLTMLGTDRKEILHRLQGIAAEDASLRSEFNRDLLSTLERTVTSPKSKAGSVVSLIDELMEYQESEDSSKVDSNHDLDGLTKLIDLGFDAVPALIEHIHDPRLTRMRGFGGINFGWESYYMRVGHLASNILQGLSGQDLRRAKHEQYDMADPEKARQWWEEARKLGEEQWLIKSRSDREGYLSMRVLARLLRVKYPFRLAEVYRKHLRDGDDNATFYFAGEILASSLPRELKIALLQEGSALNTFHERYYALVALGELDPPAIRKPVLEILKVFATKPDVEAEDSPSETRLLALVKLANDPDCWNALATVAKQAPPEFRRQLIRFVGTAPKPGEQDPVLRERIRFVLEFLGDRTVVWNDPEMECRDYAADRLVWLLGFRVSPDPDRWSPSNSERGLFTRLIVRIAMHHAAEQRLRRQPN